MQFNPLRACLASCLCICARAWTFFALTDCAGLQLGTADGTKRSCRSLFISPMFSIDARPAVCAACTPNLVCDRPPLSCPPKVSSVCYRWRLLCKGMYSNRHTHMHPQVLPYGRTQASCTWRQCSWKIWTFTGVSFKFENRRPPGTCARKLWKCL